MSFFGARSTLIVPKFRISMAFTDVLSPYAGDKNAAMKPITSGRPLGIYDEPVRPSRLAGRISI
jgi:hypothetical protein